MIYGILGGLLLAFAKSKRRGVLALPAIGLLVFGVVNRVAAASGVADAVGGALLVAGLGFLAASVFGRFRGTPLPGLAPLGLIALLGSLVLASGETVFQAMNESNADERTAVGAKSTDPGASGPYAESPDALDSAEADDVKQLLVELGPDDSLDEIRGLIDEAGVEVERAFPRLTLADDVDLAQTLILTGPADRLETLRRLLDADRENVDHTEWNGTASIPTPVDVNYSAAMASDGHLENDPRAGDQWALNVANAHEAHRLLANVTPAKKAVVAIIDTGVDDRHEDIAEVFGGSTGRGDDNGHGTHCAGIAGAATNNNLGIASLNWEGRFIEIRSYQALSGFGAGTTEEIAQAIIDAARDGADVISLSLGTWAPNPPKVEVEAVEYALDQGAIVVAAAGNDRSDAVEHAPANIPGVIAVAAVDAGNRRASFSNATTKLDRPLAAPGAGILSLKSRGGYVELSGTSMATPFVAGTLGILRALDPSITAAQAYDLLNQTATAGPDAGSVGGTVNAGAAVRSILTATPGV